MSCSEYLVNFLNKYSGSDAMMRYDGLFFGGYMQYHRYYGGRGTVSFEAVKTMAADRLMSLCDVLILNGRIDPCKVVLRDHVDGRLRHPMEREGKVPASVPVLLWRE
jgi:hypothetical protein